MCVPIIEDMDGIVVGIDESDHSQAALRWAAEHARIEAQPLTAVMAWAYLDQHGEKPGQAFDPAYSQETAERTVKALVARELGEGASAVSCVAICDLPPAALRDASTGAELLVVGARGMGGFRGLALGSVSRRALHDATCPVVVVHDDASRLGKPVVVGVDGSEGSQRALEWAIGHARRRGVRAIVIYAWRGPSVPQLWYGPHADPDVLARRASQFLDAQLADLDTSGVEIERRAVDNRPSAALIEAGVLASLVVVGSRGHGQVTNVVLGSVSDQVAHHATCPVVVVP